MSVMKQPRHRRPSWMQTRASHRVYLESTFIRKGLGIPNESTESFTYDPTFLRTWEIPQDIWTCLPLPLRNELDHWQASGAAVDTGLARLDDLQAEALDRGWPIKTHAHLSRETSTVDSCSPPQIQSPPDSFSAGTPSAINTLPPFAVALTNDPVTVHEANDVPDTPPFTPDYAKVASIAHSAAQGPVDMFQLNDRLSPLARASSDAHVFSPLQFDEIAWDFYVNSCKAEMDTLQKDTIIRFRHMRRQIDKLMLELRTDKSNPLDPTVKENFLVWWRKMAEKEHEYEAKVQGLSLPDLDKVKEERAAKGLVV